MNQHYLRKPVHRTTDRGSALLIVFVMAAMIAIVLYREMPVAAFEARRQKEETLINRGHEYQRAVQLYYRKFQGRYPANMEMLENSNNMRFLRRRYTDPFTGKDDWRLLHAGPGGQLMDSKVQNTNLNGVFGQNGTNTNGNNTTLGTGLSNSGSSAFGTGATNPAAGAVTGFSSTSSSSFGTAPASSSSSDSDVNIPPVPKRAAMVDSNLQSGGGTPTSSDLNQDPSIPLLPAQDPAQSSSQQTAATATNPQGAPVAAAGNGSTGLPASAFGSTPGQQPGQTGTGAPGSFGIASTTGSMGNLGGVSLAGVASKAKGVSIKKVNDQKDYSLWEFWYDPTKDTSMRMGGNNQNGAGGQSQQNGTQLGQPANSAFGATGFNPSAQQNSTTAPATLTPASPDGSAPGAVPAAPLASPQPQ